MTAHRKPPNAGIGRIKGVPNKATINARTAIAVFIRSNEERLNRLLDKIEQKEGPRAAWECAMRLIEYHIPRTPRVLATEGSQQTAENLKTLREPGNGENSTNSSTNRE